MTEIYRKNIHVKTQQEANDLLDAMDNWINNPQAIGSAPPELPPELAKIWNNGERLAWAWSEESEQEEAQRLAKEAAEAEQLTYWQNPANLEDWKDAKVRPKRDQKLLEWIDEPAHLDLKYDFTNWTEAQQTERADKRQELLDFPAHVDLQEYKTDAEVDALFPAAPSYITE